MKKLSPDEKKQLKNLTAQIKDLEGKLVVAKKREGIDPYIEVKVKDRQAWFERVKKKGVADRAEGHFFIRLEILAEQANIFVPLSIATGKKTAGIMYQIEGTDTASPKQVSLRARGKGVTQVTVGTLVFARVPQGETGIFEIRATIEGSFGKRYVLVCTRLNYKLQLSEVRYQQYLKEIRSEAVKLG